MSQKKNYSYRLIIFFLSLLIVVLLYKGYKDNKTAHELQNSLQEENYITQTQLTEMIEKYDSARLKLNKASIEEGTITLNSINGGTTKETVALSFKDIVSVNEQIAAIKDSIASLKKKLRNLEKLNSVTTKQKVVVNNLEKISASSKLVISNLQARGVKFIKDNSTNAQKKEIEQIRVCFSFEGNQIVDYGNKELFIQIVNPKNEIVSKDNLVFEQNNTTLRYSKKVDFLYNKQITDVCTYVDLEKNKIYKGRYLVNLYSGTKKIGSTIFNYN